MLKQKYKYLFATDKEPSQGVYAAAAPGAVRSRSSSICCASAVYRQVLTIASV